MAAPPKLTRIVDLRPSLQPVTVQFVVLDKSESGDEREMGERRNGSKHHIKRQPSTSFPLSSADPTFIRKPDPAAGPGATVDTPTCVARVADASGAVSLTLHGAEEVAALAPGDVFRLTGGLFTLDRGAAAPRCARGGGAGWRGWGTATLSSPTRRT